MKIIVLFVLIRCFLFAIDVMHFKVNTTQYNESGAVLNMYGLNGPLYIRKNCTTYLKGYGSGIWYFYDVNSPIYVTFDNNLKFSFIPNSKWYLNMPEDIRKCSLNKEEKISNCNILASKKFLYGIVNKDVKLIKHYLSNDIQYSLGNNSYIDTRREFLDKLNSIFSKQDRTDILNGINKAIFKTYFPAARLEGCKINIGNFKFLFYSSGKIYRFDKSIPASPSFNCEKVNNIDEKIICKNKKLIKLDLELANIYKDALKYLTGEEGLNLRHQQREFLASRKLAKSDVSAIEKLYNKRIRILKNDIAKEKNKVQSIINTPLKILKNMNGLWKSDVYYESGYVGRYGDFKTKNLQIDVKYPFVNILNLKTQKEYKYEIINSQTTSYASIYFNSRAYTDSMYWGSAGGSIDFLYYAYYHFITLRNLENQSIIHMVYSTNHQNDESLVIDLYGNLDGALEKKNTKLLKNKYNKIYLITSGYNLNRLKRVYFTVS